MKQLASLLFLLSVVGASISASNISLLSKGFAKKNEHLAEMLDDNTSKSFPEGNDLNILRATQDEWKFMDNELDHVILKEIEDSLGYPIFGGHISNIVKQMRGYDLREHIKASMGGYQGCFIFIEFEIAANAKPIITNVIVSGQPFDLQGLFRFG